MRVLVANRGEIAVRLILALNELGFESVAIHTPSDRLHVSLAGDAVEAPSATIFMDISSIIAIAKKSRCDAIIPGYGFLSESHEFAQTCEEEGLIFVGPSSRVLESLGDKSSAKMIARELGVPVLPSAIVHTEDDIRTFARQVKYPIMIKAQDGGGGKGIRIVRRDDEVQVLMQDAMNESPSRQIFVEKAALEGFKHIEIQVVADRHGHVRTVFERECSLQRRFQKIVEVAPSSLPRARIAALEEAAIKIAGHVGYVGLGTFEFLVNTMVSDFYFMECNPRIQVEHTITEQVSGLDLVHHLLGVTLQDANLTDTHFPSDPRGCSIQCRVNAEDPKTFNPTQGTITTVSLPAGSGIRVDSILSQLQPGTAYVATDEYDSLVAKVITTATTYQLALRKMIYAMRNLHIEAFVTNQSLLFGILHSQLMSNPESVDIRSLSEEGAVEAMAAAGVEQFERSSSISRTRAGAQDATATDEHSLASSSASSAFKKGDMFSWTLGETKASQVTQTIKIEKILKNNFPNDLSAQVSINGKKSTLRLEKTTGSSNHRKADPNNESHISLPFAGVLVEFLIDPGDQVAEAETIAVFRQGKMELDIRAPYQGIVSSVAEMKEGEAVGIGALVAVISPSSEVPRKPKL